MQVKIVFNNTTVGWLYKLKSYICVKKVKICNFFSYFPQLSHERCMGNE